VSAVRCRWDVSEGKCFEIRKHGGLEAARMPFSCFGSVSPLSYFFD